MKQDHLLMLTGYFYPDTASGTGRVMTELAEGLTTEGVAVSVVCGQPSYLAREELRRFKPVGYSAQVNVSVVAFVTGDNIVDRGLIACTATDTHDATRRVPSSIWNEWGESLMKEAL